MYVCCLALSPPSFPYYIMACITVIQLCEWARITRMDRCPILSPLLINDASGAESFNGMTFFGPFNLSGPDGKWNGELLGRMISSQPENLMTLDSPEVCLVNDGNDLTLGKVNRRRFWKNDDEGLGGATFLRIQSTGVPNIK